MDGKLSVKYKKTTQVFFFFSRSVAKVSERVKKERKKSLDYLYIILLALLRKPAYEASLVFLPSFPRSRACSLSFSSLSFLALEALFHSLHAFLRERFYEQYRTSIENCKFILAFFFMGSGNKIAMPSTTYFHGVLEIYPRWRSICA